jgi:hypothetical protein
MLRHSSSEPPADCALQVRGGMPLAQLQVQLCRHAPTPYTLHMYARCPATFVVPTKAVLYSTYCILALLCHVHELFALHVESTPLQQEPYTGRMTLCVPLLSRALVYLHPLPEPCLVCGGIARINTALSCRIPLLVHCRIRDTEMSVDGDLEHALNHVGYEGP